MKTDFSTFQTGTFLFSGRKCANPPFKIRKACSDIVLVSHRVIIIIFSFYEKLFDLKIYL